MGKITGPAEGSVEITWGSWFAVTNELLTRSRLGGLRERMRANNKASSVENESIPTPQTVSWEVLFRWYRLFFVMSVTLPAADMRA